MSDPEINLSDPVIVGPDIMIVPGVRGARAADLAAMLAPLLLSVNGRCFEHFEGTRAASRKLTAESGPTEIELWNAAVDRRRAEKKASKK